MYIIYEYLILGPLPLLPVMRYEDKKVCTATQCSAQGKDHWSYHGKENGQEKWPSKYPNCKGRQQSPVAIETKSVNTTVSMDRILYNEYNTPVTKATILNNGHTVQILPEDGVTRSIATKGSKYILQQVHFHWGSQNKAGSEHTLDGIRYDLEKSPNNNDAFDPVIQALPKILFKDQSFAIQTKFNLPLLQTGVYFYMGSLTTPGCNEYVSWFVLKGINNIGEQQMNEFYKLYSVPASEKGTECYLVNNYREVQPLNGRYIFESK
ncbi:carbonic anhydrase 14 [Trichonephila clavipes]|nr:carbonic anhydrase 14 [Trichonephila clavipes]